MAALPDPRPTLTGDGERIYEAIRARLAAKGVTHLGPYLPLLHAPELAGRIEELGYFYKFEGALPRVIYQFIVLSIAKRSGVAFIWADHIAAARAAGLPEAIIDAVDKGGTALPDPYDLVAAVLAEAFACRSIPADLQARAVARFGAEGLVEMVTLCGFYTLIAMVNGCFDVPVPKADLPLPKADLPEPNTEGAA